MILFPSPRVHVVRRTHGMNSWHELMATPGLMIFCNLPMLVYVVKTLRDRVQRQRQRLEIASASGLYPPGLRELPACSQNRTNDLISISACPRRSENSWHELMA